MNEELEACLALVEFLPARFLTAEEIIEMVQLHIEIRRRE